MFKRTMKYLTPCAFLITLMALLGVSSAKADTISTFTTAGGTCNTGNTSCSIGLSVSNTSNFPGTAPYGTVTITADSTDQVTISVAMNGNYGIHNNGFGFNYDGSDGTLTAVSCTSSANSLGGGGGDTCGPLSTSASNFDGFGFFNDNVPVSNSPTGQANDAGGLELVLNTANSALTETALLEEFINGTSKGGGPDNFFVAQIAYIPQAGCTEFAGNEGSTGGTATTNSSCGPISTPEPSSLTLLGLGLMGLLGLGMLVSRRCHSLLAAGAQSALRGFAAGVSQV